MHRKLWDTWPLLRLGAGVTDRLWRHRQEYGRCASDIHQPKEHTRTWRRILSYRRAKRTIEEVFWQFLWWHCIETQRAVHQPLEQFWRNLYTLQWMPCTAGISLWRCTLQRGCRENRNRFPERQLHFCWLQHDADCRTETLRAFTETGKSALLLGFWWLLHEESGWNQAWSRHVYPSIFEVFP